MDEFSVSRELLVLVFILTVPLIPLSCQVNRRGVKATQVTVDSVLDYPPSLPKARQFQYGFEPPPEGDWAEMPENITDVSAYSSGYQLFAGRCFSCHRIQPSQLENVQGLQWEPVMQRHRRYSGVQVTSEMARKIQFYLMWRTARNENELARVVEQFRYDPRGNDLAQGLPPRQHDRYFWNIDSNVEPPDVRPSEISLEEIRAEGQLYTPDDEGGGGTGSGSPNPDQYPSADGDTDDADSQ